MGYFRRGALALDDPWSRATASEPGPVEAAEMLRAAYLRACQDPDGAFVMVGLPEPTPAEFADVQKVLGLERHQVEDAANPHQRAKYDLGTDHGFLVLKTLGYDEDRRQVGTGQVSIFFGPTYLVAVRVGPVGDLDELRQRIGAEPHPDEPGPYGVLHAIADMVVDRYLEVSDRVQQEVERLEEAVFSPNRGDFLAPIYVLKRENLEIRRAVTPLLPLATDLAHELLPQLPAPMRPPFRDVGEHLLRVADQSESVDSLLLALMSAANAQAQLDQSSDQRRMAAWAALALIPTMVGAVYGMNFRYMPELGWRWSYPVLLGLMAVVMVVVYRRLRSAGWL
jgi:magnesium transporter